MDLTKASELILSFNDTTPPSTSFFDEFPFRFVNPGFSGSLGFSSLISVTLIPLEVP